MNPAVHELGIAQSVLDAVANELKARPGAQLKSVGLRIGDLAGVDAESLRFSWECLTRETAFGGAVLEIEHRAWKRRCPGCGSVFEVVDFQTRCPRCGAGETENEGGDELDIAYLELETP
jgi:hydrogenase nickel incorporation protein HypA/HybF